MTTRKQEIRHIWIDQIKTAIAAADNAIKHNPEDGGTCNFDSAMIKKETTFTYQETIDMFVECGCFAHKHRNGWIMVGNFHGQANRNTRWARAFAKSLERQGFTTSMYYQVD